MKPKGSIFISYRRDGGADLASRIYGTFKERGYNVFMDIEALRSGPFNTALFNEIESSSDVVVVLTPHSLDRCFNESDWMRLEVAHAIKCKRNVIPVMARGFSFPDDPLPEELAELPNYNGIESSHVYFKASMDKLESMLVSNCRARSRTARTVAAGTGLLVLFCAIGFTVWKTNTPRYVVPEPRITLDGLANELNSANLDAGKLRKVEVDLEEAKKSSLNNSEIQPIEALFATKVKECVSSELLQAQTLIANWEALPESAGWTKNLSAAESIGISGWWDTWKICHFVVTNAQSVLAEKVSEMRSKADAKVSDSSASAPVIWSPNSWRTAEECYKEGVRAQKNNQWREAWTSFGAFETNASLSIKETERLLAQYDAVKLAFNKNTFCRSNQEIQSLLIEHSDEGLFNLDTLVSKAEQQQNPQGIICYSNAIALWPKVVGRAVTNLLDSAAQALAGKQWSKGLQKTTDAIYLAEHTKLSECAEWTGQAVKLRDKILTAQANDIPLAPPRAETSMKAIASPVSESPPALPSRFHLVGDNVITDQDKNCTWIVPDIPQPMSLSESKDRTVIEQFMAKYNARLPTLEQLRDLATDRKQTWPNNDVLYLDPAFATKFRGGGVWQLSKKCCTCEKGVFYDFDANRDIRTFSSEKGVVLLWRQGVPAEK